MNIEIIENGQRVDIKNLFVTNYTEELSKKMEMFSKSDLDFSSIQQLKGDKRILNMSFIQLKEELINS